MLTVHTGLSLFYAMAEALEIPWTLDERVTVKQRESGYPGSEHILALAANAFVGKFTKLSGSILKLTKEAALAGLNDDMDQGLRAIEKIYLDKVMKTHDAIEGLKAFLEKRKPTWKNQ